MTDTAQKLDALDKLIAAVEAGDYAGFRRANRAMFSTPCQDIELQLREENARHAFKGSLDAALALHNALLPGWGWRVTQLIHGKPRAAVAKYPVVAVDVIAETPARAWLLAQLKAYRAQVAQ